MHHTGIPFLNLHVLRNLINMVKSQNRHTSNVIKEYAFNEYTRLGNIELSKNINEIGKEAFYCCTNLTKIIGKNEKDTIETGMNITVSNSIYENKLVDNGTTPVSVYKVIYKEKYDFLS